MSLNAPIDAMLCKQGLKSVPLQGINYIQLLFWMATAHFNKMYPPTNITPAVKNHLICWAKLFYNRNNLTLTTGLSTHQDVLPLILSDYCQVKTFYVPYVCQLYRKERASAVCVCDCAVGYESFQQPLFRSEECFQPTQQFYSPASDNMGNHLTRIYKVNTIRYIISSFVGYTLVICRQSGQMMGSSDWSNALNSASVKDREKEMLTGALMYVAVLRERLYNTHTHTFLSIYNRNTPWKKGKQSCTTWISTSRRSSK